MKLYIITEMLNKFLTKLFTLTLMLIPVCISIFLLVNHLHSGNAAHGGLWMLLVFNVAYQLMFGFLFILDSPLNLKKFFLFVSYIQFFIYWFKSIKSFLISEYEKISKEVES